MMSRSSLPQAIALVILTTLVALPASAQRRLFVPSSVGRVVLEFDPFTGDLIDPAAIDLGALISGPPIVPFEIVDGPRGELWIADAVADAVFRLSPDGTTLLGTLPLAVDSAGGMHAWGGGALIANSGVANGAPGGAIIHVDASGALVDLVPVANPVDVHPYTWGGTPGYLVSEELTDRILFLDAADPTVVTVFHSSNGVTGINSPRQIATMANGHVLVGGFSPPRGIYEYDTTGTQVDFIDTAPINGFGAVQGIVELGNGNLMFTIGGQGQIFVLDRATGAVRVVASGVLGRHCSFVGPAGLSVGTVHCSGQPNSTGAVGSIGAFGPIEVIYNDLWLSASGMPSGQFGMFLVSSVPSSSPLGAGTICLGGTVGTYRAQGQVLMSGPGGGFSMSLDLERTPQGAAFAAVQSGERWYFQAWFRDQDPSGASSNLTDGIGVVFR